MLTKEDLQSEIKELTKEIGKAKKGGLEDRLYKLRTGRAGFAISLSTLFDLWLLIDDKGHCEFVDRPEFEHRMTAWGRRNGLIPPARMSGGEEKKS